ncbi:MAG: rRNA adenine N-6-methyltransferase family protein [Candidatus Promineifilaceae bacterium]|nr:rRNA adenine N-6-methyltransferase family protein [Candidatus Promineifilaceae bacterium]
MTDWEQLWAAHDEDTYLAVLAQVGLDDVVLDIGAGDLRLTKRIAARAAHVYALERNPALLPPASDLPPNLAVLMGDAYQLPFPQGVTLSVLLLRHCRQFGRLLDKLVAVGCRRLVTNARWGLGVELMDLQAVGQPYEAIDLGWYACRCGAVGFVPGPSERLTAEVEEALTEVISCPTCRPATASAGWRKRE